MLQKDGADPFDLAEVLAELQRSQRQELWERQLKLLQHSLAAHPAERWITGAEEDAGDMEVEISEEQVRLLMFRKRQKTKSLLVPCQNDGERDTVNDSATCSRINTFVGPGKTFQSTNRI